MNHQTAQKLIKMTTESYNVIASLFSQTRQYSWRDFDVFKKFLPQNNSEKINILDIGCGNGRLNEFFKDYNYSYTGLDISKNLLDVGKEKYQQHKFISGNVLELDQIINNTQSFDYIFAIAMLNHIPSKQLQMQALQQMYDVLNPGGYICMTNWNLWHATFKKKSIFKFKCSIKNINTTVQVLRKHNINILQLGVKDIITIWKSGEVEVPLYYYAFTRGELKALAEKIGFKVIENKYSHNSWHKGGNIITVLQK